jgi:GNAT superfamily N-acetyltransferase
MPDMLVKLYDLKDDWSFLDEQQKQGITVRKPIGPEKHLIEDWVCEHFGDAWASETDRAISNRPVSCFIATREKALIGFSCYDATALGVYGPVGVDESCRGKGTGRALLLACMLDMKLRGYAYAVIGCTHVYEFYQKCVGATVIPDSDPSIWKDWLRRPARPAAKG